MSKTGRLKRDVAKKKAYQKYYKSMLVNGRPKKNTLSYAQWLKSSKTERSLSKAGVNWSKDKPSAKYKRSR